MKKIVAILLVVALMSAMFVVPAYAHEAEEASARAVLCDDPGGCGEWLEYRTVSNGSKVYYNVDGCTNNALTHRHYDWPVKRYYVCTNTACRYYGIAVDAVYLTLTNQCIYS